jgi:GntR family transcriptional regulator
LPARHFKRLPEDLASYWPAALAQLNGILIGHADEHVDVTVADPEDAKDLGVDEGAPLLRLDRVIFSDHGVPLEWRVARCCTRRERYMVRFS